MAANELTTTSYGILCLLAVHPWSTYELAQQMSRSLESFLPRVQSVVYAEPKRLVKLGLATAETQYTGKRKRTVYSITREGRRAVRQWLDEPGNGPSLEFEAMLQIAFADLGTKQQLEQTLTAMQQQAAETHEYVRARLDEYETSGGPFPQRLHVIMLVARFMADYAEMLERWTSWARHEVDGWKNTKTGNDGGPRRVPRAPKKGRSSLGGS
jgi:DNA-binding PadR family transcriptional regulator